MDTYSGKKIHFIGIGGVSMSALAKFCLNRGAEVSGSDAAASTVIGQLYDMGINAYVGENAAAAVESDIVVYSSAIKENHSELSAAKAANKQVYERHRFLGEVSHGFKQVAAVAGTHGKTTVTAMLAHILKECDKSFLANIGGDALGLGNYVSNREENIFVAEACEYKRSLLSLTPTLGIVTNIECDHPDCYETLESIKDAFFTFLRQSERCIVSAGTLLDYRKWLIDNKCADKHIDILAIKAKNYKNNEFAVCAEEYIYTCKYVQMCSIGIYKQSAVLFCNGQEIGKIELALKGAYNLKNVMFAIAAARDLGCDIDSVLNAVATFKGVLRRFEKVENSLNKEIVFDYAHHPTEIKCALQVAKEYGRILAVFQPHTFSRTAKYLLEFVDAFSVADDIIVLPTYAAREQESDGVNGKILANEIALKYTEKSVNYIESFKLTVDYVKKTIANYDIVIFLGAGDIYNLKYSF